MAGKKKFLSFCHGSGTSPLPLTEQKLVNFVAFAVSQGLRHQTVKCYLSAVRHMQIEWGGGDPGMTTMPGFEGGKKGASGGKQKNPPAHNTSCLGKATGSLEPRPVKPGPHHAVGGILPRLLWLSQIGRNDSSRQGRVRLRSASDSE